MPDINLDTLFIIGLILASVVGKFFKKDEPEAGKATEAGKAKSKNGESEGSLEDVIKEVWKKATETRKVQPSTPFELSNQETLVENENIEICSEESTNIESSVDILNTAKTPEYGLKNIEIDEDIKNKTMYLNLLSSKNNLRSAFVIKEILDRPVSLKN